MDPDRAFRTLGIGPDASMATAKRRFRILVRRYHPDMTGTSRTREKYQRVVEAFRVVEEYILNGPVDEDEGELDLGTALNVIELKLGGRLVPVEIIRNAKLEGSPHDNDSGIMVSVRFSELWFGGMGEISIILELGGECGKMGGRLLAASSERTGGMSGFEFEPIL
jgi:hypothetical protein